MSYLAQSTSSHLSTSLFLLLFLTVGFTMVPEPGIEPARPATLLVILDNGFTVRRRETPGKSRLDERSISKVFF